jgi:hypothetical protein
VSSLLQHHGPIGHQGVRLELVLRADNDPWNAPPHEPVACTVCGGVHEQIHVAWRKPAGMMGCWVVFRVNGQKIVPDLSIPISISRIPRDAVALSAEETSEAWHRV